MKVRARVTDADIQINFPSRALECVTNTLEFKITRGRETLCGKAQEEFVSFERFDGGSQLIFQQRIPLGGRQVVHLTDTIVNGGDRYA